MFPAYLYPCAPSFVPAVIWNPLVFRPALDVWLSSVPRILTPRCQPQIHLSVIQSVMIDMVAGLSIGSIDNLSMHPHDLLLTPLHRPSLSGSVKRPLPRLRQPLVFCKVIEILRIDDGELTACQWNSPVGITITQPPIRKHWNNQYAFETIRNCDFENELANFRPRLWWAAIL